MKPKVSVIMNCFNSARFLREAIESVLAQTFGDWEIIFWDNQSKDESATIARSFGDARIRYFYAPTHTRLGEARNLAIREARGDWVGFLDCDDLWLPHKLKAQFDLIASDRDGRLGLVYTRSRDLGGPFDGCETIHQFIGRPLPEGRILGRYLSLGNFIPLLSGIVRKDLFLQVGGIPADMNQAEDYFLFAAVAAQCEVAAVQEVCCLYRIHSANMTHTQKILGNDESIRVIDAFLPQLKAEDGADYRGAVAFRRELKVRSELQRIMQKTDASALFRFLGLGPAPLILTAVRMMRRYLTGRRRAQSLRAGS